MTHAEQHKMIAELRYWEWKMSRSDMDAYAMMVKRDKDDEDLDEISMARLVTLHEQYVVRKGKP